MHIVGGVCTRLGFEGTGVDQLETPVGLCWIETSQEVGYGGEM